MEKVKRNNKLKSLFCLIAVIAIMAAMALPVFATTPTLEISFDQASMFTWAQTIINAMLPVVYIIMGVGLGFIVIRAFKSAFN